MGVLFRKDDENEILSLSRTGLSNASNLFQWNVIDGLCSNHGEGIHIINALPVGTWPNQFKGFFLKSKQWVHRGKQCYELGCINLPFFKQYMRYRKAKKAIRQLTESDNEILIYSAYMPFLKAVYRLPSSVKITLIVTDLPEYYDLAKCTKLRKFLRKLQNRLIYRYMQRIDRFVVLTEQMKEPLHIGERPYIVLEGIYAHTAAAAYTRTVPGQSAWTDKKILFYSGTLNYVYGIKTLLDAFTLLKDADIALWICGSGEAEEEIKQISTMDPRIQFFGYLPLEEVQKLRSKASLLINPRPNTGEYTKYSFPSKTMEYLASGKPVIMYKLDGIPDSYDAYLNYLTGTDPRTVSEELQQIFNSDYRDLMEKALLGREFVLQKKNEVVQARRILDLMHCL